jgi:drug/metabolite transporter superfamily protein YnfA
LREPCHTEDGMSPILSTTALSSDTRTTAGILLLTILAVEYGGLVMLRIVRGRQPATPFQRSFARAGHAHAGVFVVFALIAQILADAAELDGIDNLLGRSGIWVAAILFPAGFFLSSAGAGRTEPNRLIVFLYAGIVSLTVGVVALGIGLLTA